MRCRGVDSWWTEIKGRLCSQGPRGPPGVQSMTVSDVRTAPPGCSCSLWPCPLLFQECQLVTYIRDNCGEFFRRSPQNVRWFSSKPLLFPRSLFCWYVPSLHLNDRQLPSSDVFLCSRRGRSLFRRPFVTCSVVNVSLPVRRHESDSKERLL